MHTTHKVSTRNRVRIRRVAASLCAAVLTSSVALGSAGAVESMGGKDAPSIKAAKTCAKIHVIYANGTFDSTPVDDPNSPRGFFGQLNDDIQAQARDEGLAQRKSDGTLETPITSSAVNYAASAGGALMPGANVKYAVDAPTYKASMEGGVKEALRQITEVASNCDETKFALAGYSQGAEVIETVARKIGAGEGPISPDRVIGVSLFASPTRQAGQPLQVGGDSAVRTGDDVASATDGLETYPVPAGGGLSFDKSGQDGVGELSDRTVSWCLNGDIVCGLPVDSEQVRTIVDSVEDSDFSDPVQTLDELAEGVSQAVTAEGVSQAAAETIDFGDEGFSLEDVEPATGAVLDEDTEDTEDAEDTESTEATEGAGTKETSSKGTGVKDSESLESSQSTATTTPSTSASETKKAPSASASKESSSSEAEPSPAGAGASTPAAVGPSPLQSFLNSARRTSMELEHGESSSSAAYDVLDGAAGLVDGAAGMINENLPDMPAPAQGSAEALALSAAQDVGARLMPAITEIGGMALGASVTTTKRTLTPENLSQIAAAGVTLGPEAAGAVTLAKFTEQGRLLLTPENASRFSARSLTALQKAGVADGEIAELAVTLTNWKSLNEHVEYTNRPMLSDGRTASEATSDWFVAAARDEGADSLETTTTKSPVPPAGWASENTTDLPVLGESTRQVDFDTQAATGALEAYRSAEPTPEPKPLKGTQTSEKPSSESSAGTSGKSEKKDPDSSAEPTTTSTAPRDRD